MSDYNALIITILAEKQQEILELRAQVQELTDNLKPLQTDNS
ncbi:hypothetical protein [Glutamicibacter sp. M10]|nr:hypothetical protein [Glutamicibacter sp. M10]UXN31019.1 hypothetical protein N6V40_11370 [Glutamicibacter sp. M10]